MIARATVGLALAGAIALTARRAGVLSRSGAGAAIVVGTASVAAGWTWGALLIAFFISSSTLSRMRAAVKARRTAGVVAKGGERDAAQVLANGGPFALAAVLSLLTPWSGWAVAAAGALAAATADTWGTELGTLANAPPRLITTWRPVPPGTSGGVTPAGLAATAAGALFIAVVAWLLHWTVEAAAAAVAGGIAGALVDSLLGAHWQERRRCTRCHTGTEQRVHACGAATERAGGIAWLNNDGVNLVSGAMGALIALLIAAS